MSLSDYFGPFHKSTLFDIFFLSRGDLQHFQFPQEHVLQRVHPLSRRYSSGGKHMFIYLERNLKGSYWFTCFSQFIRFLLDYVHVRLCCLLSSPLLFTMFHCFFGFLLFFFLHLQMLKKTKVRFMAIRAGLVWSRNGQCRCLFTCVLQDFEEACYLLLKTGALQVTAHELLVPERGHRTLHFLSSILDPFLQGYQVRH